MERIGIVGAGAGAAAGAFAIGESATETTVTVLERSRDLSGRAATRRRNGIVYDYGANYVKTDDERVAELLTETLSTDGLVDVTDPVWIFDRDGTVSEGDDIDDHKWTYRQGLAQLATRLFDRTDATIHRETRVERVVRDADADTWTLADSSGRVWGPYDAVVLNPPAPQTAALLRSAAWEADSRKPLLEAIDDVTYRSIWTGVFHYPFDLERPYYALVNTDRGHEIGWIAREECKPGHVPAGESLLIVQASPEWSVAHADEEPKQSLAELASLTADLLEDDRLTEPDWTDHRVWRHALPEEGVAMDPIRRAQAEGLYCVGDWVAGEGRLHAALRSGLEAGERIARET